MRRSFLDQVDCENRHSREKNKPAGAGGGWVGGWVMKCLKDEAKHIPAGGGAG
jgi:hypothetical protein